MITIRNKETDICISLDPFEAGFEACVSAKDNLEPSSVLETDAVLQVKKSCIRVT